MTDAVARRYKRLLSKTLLTLIWVVTSVAMWAGFAISRRWATRPAELIAAFLIVAVPSLALVFTLIFRDKIRELSQSFERRAT